MSHLRQFSSPNPHPCRPVECVRQRRGVRASKEIHLLIPCAGRTKVKPRRLALGLLTCLEFSRRSGSRQAPSSAPVFPSAASLLPLLPLLSPPLKLPGYPFFSFKEAEGCVQRPIIAAAGEINYFLAPLF